MLYFSSIQLDAPRITVWTACPAGRYRQAMSRRNAYDPVEPSSPYQHSALSSRGFWPSSKTPIRSDDHGQAQSIPGRTYSWLSIR